MNKFRLLKADEIECRISMVKDNGLSLLLYKTARTDANLLDEVVGSENWENDFKVVDGVLYGGIGIYDEATGRQIWKWDAGTESNTEAEKGRASDAFKRAGFKFGIGRELYTAPFIWIPSDKCEIKSSTDRNGKTRYNCFDNFRVVEIGYNVQCEINHLIIANDSRGVDVYTYPKYSQKQPKNESKASDVKVPNQNEKVSQKPENEPIEAPDGFYYCADCGNIIKTMIMKDGGSLSSSEIAARTLKKYGMQLCKDCSIRHAKSID